MKRSIITISVFLVFLMAGITSCGNLIIADIEPVSEASQTKITLNGMCSLEGALPAELINSASGSSSRTAFPVFDENQCIFSAYAKEKNSSTTINGTVTEDYTFTIPSLDPDKQYIITVQAKNKTSGTVMLEGSMQVTPGAVSPDDIFVELSPATSGTGDIDLFIYNDISGITDTDTFDPDDVSPMSISRLVYTLDSNTPVTINDNRTSYEISVSSITAGRHKLKIQVYENSSNGTELLSYQCTETVNVIAGMTTDTWYRHAFGGGFSPHLANPETSNAYTVGPAKFYVFDYLHNSFWVKNFFVDPDAPEGGSGTNISPFNTLDEAIEKASALPLGCTLFGAAKIYLPNGSKVTLSNSFQIENTSIWIQTYDSESADATIEYTNNNTITVGNECIFMVENATFTHSNNSSSSYFTVDIEENPDRPETPDPPNLTLADCNVTVDSTTIPAILVSRGEFIPSNLNFIGNVEKGKAVSVQPSGYIHPSWDLQVNDNNVFELVGNESGNGKIFLDKWSQINDDVIPLTLTGITDGKEILLLDQNNTFNRDISLFKVPEGYTIGSDGCLYETGAVYVNNETGNDNSENGPYATLSKAIEIAPEGGKIYLARGQTFDESSDAPAEIYIDKSLTIGVYGDGTDKAIIDNTRLLIDYVMNSGNTLSINNIAFTESKDLSSDDAAFMCIQGSTGTVYCTDCTFTGEKTNSNSSAITITGGTVNMTRCNFSNNKGERAGAIDVLGVNKLTLDACAFEGNISTDGPGAIVVTEGTLEAKDSTFTSNGTDSVGGAIKSLGTLTLDGCTFTGNTGDMNKPDAVAFKGSLTLKGTTTLSDAERFEILDTSASIAIDSTATVQDNNKNATQIPLYWDEIGMTDVTPFASGSGSLAAALFTIDEQVEGSYIINSSGTIVTLGASGSISTPAVFDDLTVTLAPCGGTQVAPTFKDNSSNGTTIALTDLSSISCEVTYYGDVVPADKYDVSAEYHISLYSSLPDGPYTITIYFTYNGKAYQASFPVTKEGANVTL